MIRAAVLVSVLSLSGAFACPMPTGAIPLTSTTQDAPTAYAQMDALPLSAPFTIGISFCETAENAKTLSFDALMPEHQHGMNFTVDVAEIGDNRFEVSNVVFHMPGLWEIRVEAEIDGQDYSYTAEMSLE